MSLVKVVMWIGFEADLLDTGLLTMPVSLKSLIVNIRAEFRSFFSAYRRNQMCNIIIKVTIFSIFRIFFQ